MRVKALRYRSGTAREKLPSGRRTKCRKQWHWLACGSPQAESIPLISEHGTFVVRVVINDRITLNFTIDSGASDVSIPADVFRL